MQDPASPEDSDRDRTRRRAVTPPAPMTGVATSTTTMMPTARARRPGEATGRETTGTTATTTGRRPRRRRGQEGHDLPLRGQRQLAHDHPVRQRHLRTATTATHTTSSRRSSTRTRRRPKEYPGKNLNARGQAIFDNGCVRPKPPPSCELQAALTATDAGGTAREPFTYQEPVYARGENLAPDVTFAVTVTRQRLGQPMSVAFCDHRWHRWLRRPRLETAHAVAGDEGYRIDGDRRPRAREVTPSSTPGRSRPRSRS